jgi:SulP family sulfate permease
MSHASVPISSSYENNTLWGKIGDYFKNSFRADLIAGIVIGLIALPLSIAFAVASGARPEQGIYSGILGGIIIGLLSGSKYQVSGPTGAFVVILLGIVNKFGIDGLMTAGLMAGIILVLMGIFKFGRLIKYIPYPVTVGFTSGIAVIIFSGQIKDFFGLHFEHRPSDFIETIQMAASHIVQGVNVSSLIIGLITLFVYIIWQKKIKKFPPAPVAVLAGIVASFIISYFFKNLLPAPILIGDLPVGLPQFKVPPLSFETVKLLLPSAFTIAMLGSIESLLSAVVADGMTGTKHNSNKELIAQGIGNMIMPFFGALPATGAIARTGANIRTGAKTRFSSVIHGLTLLLILLVAGSWAKYIPMAALAGVLIMIAFNMSEISHFKHLLKSPPQDAGVLLMTFLLTVFVDLTVAVSVGIVLAAILFIQRASRLTLNKIDFESANIGSPGSKRLHASLSDYPKIQLYEVAGPLFFGVAAEFENQIQHNSNEILILRMKHVTHMDATGIHALEVIIDRVLKNNGKIYLSTLNERLKKKLAKLAIIQKIGGDRYITRNTTEAIRDAKKELASMKTS